MGKIKDRKSLAPETRTKTVEYGGESFTLEYTPSLSFMARTLHSMGPKHETMVTHVAKMLKVDRSELEPPTMNFILLVTETLQHEDDPKRRYDVTEIAGLAASEPLLFAALQVGALELIGASEDDAKTGLDPIIEAALPNSPEEAGSDGLSSTS